MAPLYSDSQSISSHCAPFPLPLPAPLPCSPLRPLLYACQQSSNALHHKHEGAANHSGREGSPSVWNRTGGQFSSLVQLLLRPPPPHPHAACLTASAAHGNLHVTAPSAFDSSRPPPAPPALPPLDRGWHVTHSLCSEGATGPGGSPAEAAALLLMRINPQPLPALAADGRRRRVGSLPGEGGGGGKGVGLQLCGGAAAVGRCQRRAVLPGQRVACRKGGGAWWGASVTAAMR